MLAASLALALAVPALAHNARETAQIVRALALQSGNPKVQEALRTLESEGFLGQMSDALSDGAAASQTASPAAATSQAADPLALPAGGAQSAPPAQGASAAPAAGGGGAISDDQAKQIAADAAIPEMTKAFGQKATIAQYWVTHKKSWGGSDYIQVRMMPGNTGLFFVHYFVDIDASTGKVLKVH